MWVGAVNLFNRRPSGRNFFRTACVRVVSVLLAAGTCVEAQMLPHLPPLPPEVEEAIYSRACGLFNRDALPPGSPYIPDRAVCGTPALLGLASNWHRLSKRTVEAFSTLFLRPGSTHSVTSPGGHFKIHYSTFGSHRVDPADNDRNGIPDYVDEVSRTFDSVWDLQINRLGYNPPPSDGDPFYDIYLRELSTQLAYGFVTSDLFDGSTASSYMEIDNNFTDAIYPTQGLDGLHVAAAHEFFHAVQFGYYASSDAVWWQELTATWMEDVAYDEVNDYYQYLSGFFSFPSASLDAFRTTLGGARIFGASVYAHHLEQVYGADAVRKTWEVLLEREEEPNPLVSINAGMPLGGFSGVLPRFAVWNYLTESRTRSGYYPEASRYPSVQHKTVSLGPGESRSDFGRVDYLGAAYLRVPTAGLSGGLRGTFQLDGEATWILLALLMTDGGVEVLWPGGSNVEIPNVQRYSEVVFVPMATSLSGVRLDYDYEISARSDIRRASDLVGDFNGDRLVNFGDFLTFAEGYTKKPVDAGYNQRLDLNGDGRIDLQDFLIFVSHHGESAIQ